jgi:hypothetical protein
MSRRKKRRHNQEGVGYYTAEHLALVLGTIGAGLGVAASAYAAANPGYSTRRKIGVGAVVGGLFGITAGVLLPRPGRDYVVFGNGGRRRVRINPIGLGTAIVAGTVLALTPVAAVAAGREMRGQMAAPYVRGTYGERHLDVRRYGDGWIWNADGGLSGSAATRREALEQALGEMAADAGPEDEVTLQFYPTPNVQIQVRPLEAGVWSWSTTGGGSGQTGTRGTALLATLDWVDSNSDLL